MVLTQLLIKIIPISENNFANEKNISIFVKNIIMSYEKKIEIYKVIIDFKTPLASNPSKIANCPLGEYLIIMDDEVWIRDYNDNREEQFAKANYSPEFVRMNEKIFDEIS